MVTTYKELEMPYRNDFNIPRTKNAISVRNGHKYRRKKKPIPSVCKKSILTNKAIIKKRKDLVPVNQFKSHH